MRVRPRSRKTAVPLSGITPAYVGKTSSGSQFKPSIEDHPRTRGKDSKTRNKVTAVQGSPPHTRERQYKDPVNTHPQVNHLNNFIHFDHLQQYMYIVHINLLVLLCNYRYLSISIGLFSSKNCLSRTRRLAKPSRCLC